MAVLMLILSALEKLGFGITRPSLGSNSASITIFVNLRLSLVSN